MASHAIAPDIVLCSTAVRTRETLSLVLPELKGAAPIIHYVEELYLASDAELLQQVRSVDAGAHALMLVGHNPGLHKLAMALAGHGRREEIGSLRNKLPTAGLAVLHLPARRFADVMPAEGTLAHFVSPRQIA